METVGTQLTDRDIRHAMIHDWNDQHRDYFARGACGVWPWDQESNECITSGDDVTCPKCLEVQGG
jgi:hypothetical protein